MIFDPGHFHQIHKARPLIVGALLLLVGPLCSPPSLRATENYSYQVLCLNQIQGCPCYRQAAKDKLRTVYHMQAAWPVALKQSSQNGFTQIRVDTDQCWYPTNQLKKYPYTPLHQLPIQSKLDHRLLPLHSLMAVKSALDAEQKISRFQQTKLGFFWPTYYHLAMQDFHPGKAEPILSTSGTTLAYGSRKFQQQIMWEGSGITSTGLRLHYSGRPYRFTTYSSDIWAWGAGYNYTVWPYRTIAVNFSGFCKAMQLPQPCGKKDVIGSLVWIKNIADEKPAMPGAVQHDGFFCATDTGSPSGIRRDRIDIFVGVHGGGNPYLPPARRGNFLYNAGFKSLVRQDWRLWTSLHTRTWCSLADKDYDPQTGISRNCFHDYHTTARHKALQVYYFKDNRNRPLKCQPGLGFQDLFKALGQSIQVK
ncbi:MAG: hypothetical protein KDK39_05100 [Leptospiraceae bacterium]|nr:hypothetical protein [Leptospiraceae bacterium]